MRRELLLPLTCVVFLWVATTGTAQEWPRFRGLNGSGVSTVNLPAEWKEQDFNWKAKLPGKGHASPVLWGKQIYATSADHKTGQRFLSCVHADSGAVLWQRDYPGAKSLKHEDNSLASASPAADEQHVYITLGSGKEYLVIALDHTGKEIWRRDVGPAKIGYGLGASPITHGDLLIVPNDQDGASALSGLDRLTGAVRWMVPRKSKSSYSTPCVYQPATGPAQLIFTSYEHGVTSIDPGKGAVNWELDVFHKGHMETAIGSPIVAGGLILAPCGWLSIRHEVVAVRPPLQPKSAAKKMYELHNAAPLCTTPLAVDDLVFLWSEKGVVTCAELQTGAVLWQKRVSGSYYSSPVCAGKHLFNISREGDVVVLEAARQYKPLAESRLAEGSHATPALAHGRVYVRTFTSLVSVGGKNTK